jgi:diguanylate cyclase (GGDEF)-like protein
MGLTRKILISAATLVGLHALSLATLGDSKWGAFSSDTVQMALGIMLVWLCWRAMQNSQSLARNFWLLTTVAFSIWVVAQASGTYADIFPVSNFIHWGINLLFCFWSVPLAMALFLDPDGEGRVDLLLILDFAQSIIFCVAAYLFFFYLPHQVDPTTDLSYSVWGPYFTGYGIVTGAFLLRALLTQSVVVRRLFGPMGAFLAVSGVADCLYYYGPGRGLKPGAWFDILWSAVLLIPIARAVTWKMPTETSGPAVTGRVVVTTQLFPLLFPLLILGMFERIARLNLTLAASIVLASFLCSSARLLVTHLRLLKAQEDLRREASHDGLTGLWNRSAILEILLRELQRAERSKAPVGVILGDADHFKLVNDSNGHAAGDRALRIIARQITGAIRPYDSAGRYGGEEFLIVAPDCNATETFELAERIRNSIGSCMEIPLAGDRRVTLSLGIVASEPGSGAESLLHAADKALYEAKHLGRNRVEPPHLAGSGGGLPQVSTRERS